MFLLNALRRLVGQPKRARGAAPRLRGRRRWNRRPLLEELETRTLPSTLTVLNNHDSGSGSLRAMIAAAQSGDTIRFDHHLHGQTITLTSGELVIDKSLDIEGLGADANGSDHARGAQRHEPVSAD